MRALYSEGSLSGQNVLLYGTPHYRVFRRLWDQYWEFSKMLRGEQKRRFLLFFCAIKSEHCCMVMPYMMWEVKLKLRGQMWVCQKNFEISCRILIISCKNRNGPILSPLHGVESWKYVFRNLYYGNPSARFWRNCSFFTYLSITFFWNSFFHDWYCKFFRFFWLL